MSRAILLLALPATACISSPAYLGEGSGGNSSTQAGGGMAMETGGTASDPGGAPSPSWLIAYEGVGDTLNSVSIAGLTVAANGDLLINGGFTGRVDFDPGPGSDVREVPYAQAPDGSVNGALFITRLDPTHVPIWTRTYEGAGNGGASLVLGLDGAMFLADEFTGTADFDPGSGEDLRTAVGENGATNAFVTKLSAAGDALWTRTIDGLSTAKVAVLPNGNALVFGYFVGTVDLDPGAGVDERTADASVLSDTGDGYLLELDSNGNLVRPAFTFGGPDWDEIRQVRVDAAGNRYLLGGYSQGADLQPGPAELRGTVNGSRPYGSFVTALDPDGAPRWTRTYDQARLVRMVLGPSGCFITGMFHTGTDLDPGPGEDIRPTFHGNADDWFLSKLDAAGNVQWTRNWLNNGREEPPLAAFEDGSVTAIVNYGTVDDVLTDGIDGEAFPRTTVGWAVALYAFAHDGATLSRRYFGTEEWALCQSAAASPSGMLLLGGEGAGAISVLDAGMLPLSARFGAAFVASVPAH